MDQEIFTLDARGNIMFETMQGYFKLDDVRMFHEINATFLKLISILKDKKIDYRSLKNALVPRPERNKAAFIFDTTRIHSSWYGLEVFHRFFPSLLQSSTHSVLCGDYIGENNAQERLYEAFRDAVILVKNCDWKHSTQFYIVYINNLSNTMKASLNFALSAYDGFIGYADCNSPTAFKTYLSFMLVNSFVKVGQTIILAHEDDRSNVEDVNLVGYPFEKYGYTYKSVQASYSDPFLGYKIERAVFPGFESDTKLCLNAISSTVVPLEDCEVEVEESKLEYLLKEKQGSMKKSGLISLSREEVAQRIRERLASNYIFNLKYIAAHRVIKFNTILNLIPEDTGQPVRILASLEYRPAEKRLRLITLF